jgi:K(+)-stimulated pyrophosphate-energized sodium pump
VIKFTTLFGLLAVEIAVQMKNQQLKYGIGGVIFLIALFFVYRSFYGMRIPEEHETEGVVVIGAPGDKLNTQK